MQERTHTVLEAAECNPYLRVAMIQPFVMEGDELRIAYDHRLFLILEGEGELILRNEPLTALALPGRFPSAMSPMNFPMSSIC